jgi:hypothetical protein
MTKRERMYEEIRKHGENLNNIFHTDLDPVKLCKKLFKLENKAHHAATCLCNTNTLDRLALTRDEEHTGHYPRQATEDEQDLFFDKILKSVRKILNVPDTYPIFINHDPRGYALKIKSEYVSMTNMKIYTDWGGYGIIAPEFTGE